MKLINGDHIVSFPVTVKTVPITPAIERVADVTAKMAGPDLDAIEDVKMENMERTAKIHVVAKMVAYVIMYRVYVCVRQALRGCCK